MTQIVGNVVDVGFDGVTGTLRIWSGFRPEESMLIAPRRKSYDITAGVIPDGVQAAPGPAVIELDMGLNAFTSFRANVPDQAEVTIQDLFLQGYVWTPYVLAEGARYLEETQEEAARAVDAAEAATAAEDRIAVEHEHVHQDVQHVDDMAAQVAAALDQANVFSQDQVPPYLQDAVLKSTYPSAVVAKRSPLGLVSYADLQAAADMARSTGRRLVAEGVCQTDQTIHVLDDCDLSRLAVEYTGTGVAVRAGEAGSVTLRKSMKLPVVRNMNKAGSGWASVAGTVGVELVNLNTCYEVHVPGVRNFAIGLLDRGADRRGHVYNTVTIGTLENNERNHVVRAEGLGWANENLYLGGRWSHYSNEGSAIPGCKHIDIEASDGNDVNNNVWLRPAVEGYTVEWALDCNGAYNMLISARWEGTATVRWGPGAGYNSILGGYATYRIKAPVSLKNYIGAPHRHDLFSGGSSGSVQFGSSSSSADAAWQILDTRNGVTTEDWTWRASALSIQGRRSTEPFPRLVLDASGGGIEFGNGGAAPQSFIRQYGTSPTLRTNANLRFDPDNTRDIGSPTMKPKDVFVGNHIRLGSLYLRDGGGTLQVSTDGITWKAVTLTP